MEFYTKKLVNLKWIFLVSIFLNVTSCDSTKSIDLSRMVQRLNSTCTLVNCQGTELEFEKDLLGQDRLIASIFNPEYPIKTDKEKYSNAAAYILYSELKNTETNQVDIQNIVIELIEDKSVSPFEYDIDILNRYAPFVDTSTEVLELIGNRKWTEFGLVFNTQSDSIRTEIFQELVSVFEKSYQECGSYTEYDFYQLSMDEETVFVQIALLRNQTQEYLNFTLNKLTQEVMGLEVLLFCDND